MVVSISFAGNTMGCMFSACQRGRVKSRRKEQGSRERERKREMNLPTTTFSPLLDPSALTNENEDSVEVNLNVNV